MQKNNYKNFWEYYIKNISPKLEQIDILLKAKSYNIPLKTASLLLNINQKEIESIMLKQNISHITSKNFLSIMLNGKSYICNILKKEYKKNFPQKYSPEDVSYIYNIDYEKTKQAFEFLNAEEMPSKALKAIFIQITHINHI